jgi:hypothetical protein
VQRIGRRRHGRVDGVGAGGLVVVVVEVAGGPGGIVVVVLVVGGVVGRVVVVAAVGVEEGAGVATGVPPIWRTCSVRAATFAERSAIVAPFWTACACNTPIRAVRRSMRRVAFDDVDERADSAASARWMALTTVTTSRPARTAPIATDP